jgi:hypothetical protein
MTDAANKIRSSRRSIQIKNAKQAIFVLLACFSLVTASLGACVCPHHESSDETSLSCHSESHDMQMSEGGSNANRAEIPCVCFRDPSPVILTKSERKKAVEQKDQATSVSVPFDESVTYGAVATRPITDTGPDSYKYTHRRSAPSRAPPRL